MGGLFSNCDKKKEKEEKQSSRVDEADQLRIDLQSRKRQVNDYVKRMNEKITSCQKQAQAYLKTKNKSRAIMALKLKKIYNAEIDKAQGMVNMLERSIMDLDSTQINSQVYEVLKDGNKMIKELQAKVSIEDLEQIKEDSEEAAALNKEISDFMSAKSLDDNVFLQELDKIENDQVKAEIVIPDNEVPTTEIKKNAKVKENVTVVVEKPEEEKQLVAA